MFAVGIVQNLLSGAVQISKKGLAVGLFDLNLGGLGGLAVIALAQESHWQCL